MAYFSVALFLVACSGSSGLERVPEGDWGGRHVALTVEPTGARVEFDCAHGRIDGPLTLDGEGRFSASGTYVPEQGGPEREGEPEDVRAARYSGSTDGTSLTLLVTLAADGTTVGPYSASRNEPPRLFKCV